MSPILLLTSFEGSIGRAAFWAGSALVAVLLLGIDHMTSGTDHAAEIAAFAGTFAIFPWAALGAKRARDRGRPWLYGSLLVLAVVLLELLARHQPGQGAGAAAASLALWLLALVDLGLMPGVPARHAGEAIARTQAGAKPAA